jgi:hypothetical protein
LTIIKFQKTHVFVLNFNPNWLNWNMCHNLKLVNLGFRYFSCLLLSNGLIFIPKTSNIHIRTYEKGKLWTPHVPLLVHLKVHLPSKSQLHHPIPPSHALYRNNANSFCNHRTNPNSDHKIHNSWTLELTCTSITPHYMLCHTLICKPIPML